MSVRRLLLTTAAMAAVAAALHGLTPALPAMADALAHPQHTADRTGPESLVLAAAGLLAWLTWAWGALGLALTAASALPGVLGGAARFAVRVVLPAGARRSAAVVLGLGLGVAGPLVVVPLPSASTASAAVPDWPAPPAAVDSPRLAPVPDWPAAPIGDRAADGVPDWSPPAAGDHHVVVRGDCLWSIAQERLRGRLGHEPTAAEVATAVHAWWTTNEAVIGPDPDLLLPGQVLRPPS